MARAASPRRSRAASSRASFRARASRASARRSCTSRNAFSRSFSAVSASGKIVGGLGPLALGGGDGVEQLHAALLDLGGKIGKRGKIGAGLFLPRAQGEDLLARIGDALPPQLFFLADRLHPLLPEHELALEAFERGIGPCRGLAAPVGASLCRFERRL